MNEKTLTSAHWQSLKPFPKVIDPDGWDRENFEYSWFEERITEQEYERRLYHSTCVFGQQCNVSTS